MMCAMECRASVRAPGCGLLGAFNAVGPDEAPSFAPLPLSLILAALTAREVSNDSPNRVCEACTTHSCDAYFSVASSSLTAFAFFMARSMKTSALYFTVSRYSCRPLRLLGILAPRHLLRKPSRFLAPLRCVLATSPIIVFDSALRRKYAQNPAFYDRRYAGFENKPTGSG